MIHPSYVDLMNVVNKDAKEGETPIINSRYSIVMATAKRARQIVDGDAPMVDEPIGRKPLSIAIDELQEEELKILPVDEEEIAARELEDRMKAAARATGYASVGSVMSDGEEEESHEETTDEETTDEETTETSDEE